MTTPDTTLAIGLDIGGTETKAVVVNGEGTCIHESSAPTAEAGRTSQPDVIARLRERVANIQREIGKPIAHVGVAVPGLASRDERSVGWLPAGKLALQGVDLTRVLDWPSPVPVLNDAHAALLGEVWRGGAANRRDVVLLTLGTGVGGAILADGKLVRGAIGRAGHLGHIGIGTGSPPSVCNLPGALEDAIGEQTLSGRARGKFGATRAVVDAMKSGDPHAAQIWDTSIKHLAYAIASFINMLDPEVIVISGGIAKAKEHLFVPLRKHLAAIEWRPVGGEGVPIVPAVLGEWAGAMGAAARALGVIR